MRSQPIKTRSVSLINNGTIITPFRVIERGSIFIENDRIAEIREKESSSSSKWNTADTIDAENKIVIPGMIDIHTHGLEGGSVFDCSAESIGKMGASFPRYGVTSFLPTTGAESRQMLLQTAEAVARLMEDYTPSRGAQVLGMNLEGPFISKTKPGAQQVGFIRDPDFKEFNQIYERSRKTVRLITVAPELNGALELIRDVNEMHITVAAGHSNATYEQMISGIDAGVTHASHTFNAMREFRHRDPGMLAAILTRDEVTAELIADNVHVHEGAMRLLIKAKGAENVVLVSDSMPLTGMPDGKYDLAGFKIELLNGALTLPGGQLAGSATTLEKSLKIMTMNLGIPLAMAVRMASTNPARVAKVGESKGSIEEGKDADLAILDKHDLSVHATIIKGQVAYKMNS